LTEGLFLPAVASDALAQLESALEKTTAAKPVITRLRNAMRDGQLEKGDPEQCLGVAVTAAVIDEREAAQVRAAIAARQQVIGVDEFPPDYWKEDSDSWQRKQTPSQLAGQSS